MISTQPLNTIRVFDDGECSLYYPARSSTLFQTIQEIYPNSVLEVMLEGSICVLTVNQKQRSGMMPVAMTTVNLKTLRVAPTGCHLDKLNMAMVRNEVFNL
jgi:hypothetical protein